MNFKYLQVALIFGVANLCFAKNVVFFLVDDLGWTDIGAYGSEFYETPNLDKLASEGVRFTQGYAASHVCSPTRASIMTGKYPGRTHMTDWFGGARQGALPLTPYDAALPLSETTIAEALKENGYSTVFLGKWHLGGSAYWPENQGFDTNIGGVSQGSPPGGYFSPYNNPRLPDGPDGEYLTDRLGQEAIDWLDQHKDEKFFMYFSFYQVHNPMQPRVDLLSKYQTKLPTMTYPPGPEFVPVGNGYTHTQRQFQNQPDYAAMVEAHDQAVGAVLDKLEELGLDTNTIVIYTSDNGGLTTSEGQRTSNVPLKAGKGWLYEGGIREPLLVKWPGVASPGSLSDQPVISNDFYPTLLEMLNLPSKPNQHIDGISFVPALLDSGNLNREELYWHYPHYSNQGGRPGSAIRMGDFKLIENFEDSTIELYNIADDIGETINLAQDSIAIADLLLNKLHTWRSDVNANMPPGYQQQPTPSIPVIRGCTDKSAENYNMYATQDDGNCSVPLVRKNRSSDFKITIQSNSIYFKASRGTWDLSLISLNGEVLKTYTKVQDGFTFNFNQIQSGVYILKVNNSMQRIYLL